MKLKEKKQFVEKFKEEIKSSGSVIVVSYQGLDANAVNILRKELKEAGCILKVVKNRLVSRAFEGAGKEKYADLLQHLNGPVAVILATEDPSAGLKIFKKHSSDNESMFLKAGIVVDGFYEAGKLEKIAELPDVTVLIAQVVNVFNAPIQNLHTVMSGIIKKLIYALKDLQEKKPAASDTAGKEKAEAEKPEELKNEEDISGDSSAESDTSPETGAAETGKKEEA